MLIDQSVLSYEHQSLDEPTIEVWNGNMIPLRIALADSASNGSYPEVKLFSC